MDIFTVARDLENQLLAHVVDRLEYGTIRTIAERPFFEVRLSDLSPDYLSLEDIANVMRETGYIARVTLSTVGPYDDRYHYYRLQDIENFLQDRYAWIDD